MVWDRDRMVMHLLMGRRMMARRTWYTLGNLVDRADWGRLGRRIRGILRRVTGLEKAGDA